MSQFGGPQCRPSLGRGPLAEAALTLVLTLTFAACGAPESGATASMSAEAGAAGDVGPAAGPHDVLPGIDVLLRDSLHLVAGRRVGLITNPSGMDARGRSTIDLLHAHPEVELVALFAPEHGLRATAGEGRLIEDSTDPETGLPIISIYYGGSKRAPSPADLEGIDVLLFDIQDVGARYYTYIYSMALSMGAAGRSGVPFVVLDRPNPIGGLVQGNVLDPAFATFVGLYAIPMRHGMTPGEHARTFRGLFGVEADLSVVPMEGWDPSMLFDETGLPWVPPSPNMPDLVSALHYPGTCLFEGTNLSVGRGTARPFQQVGAPWLDPEALASTLTDYGLEGVRFEAVRFTPTEPTDGKWAGEEVAGVRFVVTDPAVYDPTVAAIAALIESRRQSVDRWAWNEAHFDRLAGTDQLRIGIEAGRDPEALTSDWAEARAAFEEASRPFRLYPR